MLEVDWSISLKSISVNSKKDSSIPSNSATLALPLTSISFLPSKHNPSILCNKSKNLFLSSNSPVPILASNEIEPQTYP